MKKAILTLALIVIFHSARAEIASPWQQDGNISARLVAATANGETNTFQTGMDIRLRNGSKLYWRTPGDAGIAPEFDWTASGNLDHADVHWPAPHRYSEFGFESHVYTDHVLLPITVTPKTLDQPVQLNLAFDALLCDALCTPAHLKLSLDLDSKTKGETNVLPELDQAFATLPAAESEKTGHITQASFADETLTIHLETESPLKKPDLFVETTADASFDAPIIQKDEQTTVFTLRMRPSPIAPETLVGLPLTFTITGGAIPLETTKVITAPPLPTEKPDVAEAPQPKAEKNIPAIIPLPEPPAAPKPATLSLGLVLLMALSGGLLLNVMPCVLPVLSLKLLTVLRHGGAARKTIRIGFLFSAGGIITFFIGLAGIVIIMQQMGTNVGWGFHFQEPAFIAFLMLLMLVFAANMAGLFEIPIPAWLSRSGSGHFLEGMLAAIMATPCSAPFLGVAVGYALSRGPMEILLVFLMLGLGLAIPFLLVATMPGCVRFLPKPGMWMVHLKRGLAIILAATALWLGSVLAGQLLPAPSHSGTNIWQPFVESRIMPALTEGKTVVISATADWCLTCKANEALVYDNDAIQAALAAPHILPMRGDWTRRDETLAAFMAKHGRRGVPFAIVFSEKYPDGYVLPEVMTPAMLLDALQADPAP